MCPVLDLNQNGLRDLGLLGFGTVPFFVPGLLAIETEV
jgi:hypothetical protein